MGERKSLVACRPQAPAYLTVPLNKRRLPMLALFSILMCCTFAHNMVQGKQGCARASPPQGKVGLPA